MLTDYEKVKNLFDDLGIDFEEYTPESKYKIIQLEANSRIGSKIVGYSMFWTEFKFDSKGNFIEVGIWE